MAKRRDSFSELEFLSSTEAEEDYETSRLLSVDTEEIKDCVNVLSNNHWQDPRKLNKGHPVLEKYNTLFLFYSVADERGKRYVKDIISTQYSPSKIKEGTVGSFLFGCLNQDYGDVEKSCTPKCQHNIGSGICPRQTWISIGQYPNRFVKSNGQESDQAYVYVNEGFSGFSAEEIASFRKNEITQLTLLMEEDGIYVTYKENINIENLINLSDEEYNRNGGQISNSTSTSSESNGWSFLPFLIVIVIVILIVCFFKYRR